MNRYRYLATTVEGDLQQGEMEALSAQEVAERLREKALFPVEIKEARRAFNLKNLLRRSRDEELLLFTRQLERLLEAGLPLDRALKMLSKIFSNTGKAELARLCQLLSEELSRGKSLAEALQAEPFFPDFYVQLVEAGELSGALEKVLADLARYLEEKRRFREELVSALLYPSFLLFFGFFAVQTVLVYVLPRFSLIFQEMDVSPPALTRFLLALGLFWRDWGPIFLLLLLALFFYLRFKYASPENRPLLEKRLLRLPLLGRVMLMAELARVFRSLAVMLRGGVSIEQALKMASGIPGLKVLQKEMASLAEEIKHGQRLSSLLAKFPGRVEFLLELVAIGEETGDLASSFEEIASLCEEEVRTTTSRFLKLLEPVTILFFGLLLGIIIISLLLAIFDLNIS